MDTKEIEARFLEIDKDDLALKLQQLGATDLGETILQEIIFYDPQLIWRDERKFVRLRKSGETTKLTYKHHQEQSIDGAVEIEVEVSDIEKAEVILEKIGLVAYRHQEKKRHSFQLGEITFDIDTWPKIPTYVELEGPSEHTIKNAAAKIGFDWGNAVFDDARAIIEKKYGIPVSTMHWFTFDRFE